MRNTILACVALVSIAWSLGGCAGQEPERAVASQPGDTELDRLADWLTGSFSSAAQSRLDPDYFDIRIHAVRIWRERSGFCRCRYAT